MSFLSKVFLFLKLHLTSKHSHGEFADELIVIKHFGIEFQPALLQGFELMLQSFLRGTRGFIKAKIECLERFEYVLALTECECANLLFLIRAQRLENIVVVVMFKRGLMRQKHMQGFKEFRMERHFKFCDFIPYHQCLVSESQNHHDKDDENQYNN